MIRQTNVDRFSRYGGLNGAEGRARYVAAAEQYARLLNIEANTRVAMAHRMYLPARTTYSSDLAASVAAKAEIGITATSEKKTVQTITDGMEKISAATDALEKKNAAAHAIEDPSAQDDAYRDTVVPAMATLRSEVDAMEEICSEDYWPVPSYNAMLFWV